MKKRIAAMVLAGAMALSLAPAYGATEVKAEASDMKISPWLLTPVISQTRALIRLLTRHVRNGQLTMEATSTITNQRVTPMRHVTQVLTRL